MKILKILKRIKYIFVGIALVALSCVLFVVLAIVYGISRVNPIKSLQV